jgi:hypothetical protein
MFHNVRYMYYMFIADADVYCLMFGVFVYSKRVEQIFQMSSSNLKILAARTLTYRTFHPEDPQIIGTTLQNLIARVTWRPRFVHTCIKILRL